MYNPHTPEKSPWLKTGGETHLLPLSLLLPCVISLISSLILSSPVLLFHIPFPPSPITNLNLVLCSPLVSPFCLFLSNSLHFPFLSSLLLCYLTCHDQCTSPLLSFRLLFSYLRFFSSSEVRTPHGALKICRKLWYIYKPDIFLEIFSTLFLRDK